MCVGACCAIKSISLGISEILRPRKLPRLNLMSHRQPQPLSKIGLADMHHVARRGRNALGATISATTVFMIVRWRLFILSRRLPCVSFLFFSQALLSSRHVPYLSAAAIKMSSRHAYEMTEISSAASGHRLSRTVSSMSRNGTPPRRSAPTSDHASNTGKSYPLSQIHDPASPALLSNEKAPQYRLNSYDRWFTNGWGLELLAWLLAAASLLALIAIFTVFSNKPLGE